MATVAAIAAARHAWKKSHWTLQYASGLYADLDWKGARAALTLPKPGEKRHLALLGNCCSVASPRQTEQTAKFLIHCSEAWEKIFLVPGLRELSSSTENGAESYYKQLDALHDCADKSTSITGKKNVYILNQEEYFFNSENICLMGVTGWTATPSAAQMRSIYFQKGLRLSATEIREWHNEDMYWLQERNAFFSIKDSQTKRIILSHFLYSYDLASLTHTPASSHPSMILPLASVEPFSCKGAPRPYAWLCGAGAGSISGMHQGIFIAVNSLKDLDSQPFCGVNPQYVPARILQAAG